MIKYVKSKSTALKNLLLDPSHLDILVRNISRVGFPVLSDAEHLDEAVNWLCRAHDATGKKGVSAGYMMTRGWQPPYPETTGYIIPTFLKYAELKNNDKFRQRAIEMGEWELEIQYDDGSVASGIGTEGKPMVFNTGQVMIGLQALYETTGDDRFLEGSKKAGDWLVDIQSEKGDWNKHVYCDIPHSYHSRVAWPLADLYRITGEKKYKNAAIKNVEWVLSVTEENGWSKYMAFDKYQSPFTHTIAYTFRGLLECAALLPEVNESAIKVVTTGMEKILEKFENRSANPVTGHEYLPSRLNMHWQSRDKESCITGNAQLSIVFMKLYELSGNASYFSAAQRLIDHVKKTQSLKSVNQNVKGAIPGSFPIWGNYLSLIYPNWAAKFFADAQMFKMKLLENG
ncbi:MAG: glycoside hydrolase family 127 protein [Candidatus Electryonea clarkiae]|nr:glycoside hydrolase family 127 protein [Candidatus Electryonea clarkiae]MDP8288244.1 glycoside hydrolase family 127 protein [Candidatus Electryonea clarkiae]